MNDLEIRTIDKSYYVGIGLGVETKPKPFVVVDGVVYINSALIEQATIKMK